MALTPGFQLPFGVQVLNPYPLNSWSGPYEGATEALAIAAANAAIPAGVRYKSMEVYLIINNAPKVYWYENGTSDSDLVDYSANWDSVFSTVQTISAGQYAPIRRFDLTDDGYTTYSGIALYGTNTYDFGWKITRLKTTLVGTVSSNEIAYDASWDDRYITVYT